MIEDERADAYRARVLDALRDWAARNSADDRLPCGNERGRMLGMAIIEELLTAIERDGRTQYELARDSGVAASQISRLRHGLRTIHLDTAERLAQALGLELREIPRARKGR